MAASHMNHHFSFPEQQQRPDNEKRENTNAPQQQKHRQRQRQRQQQQSLCDYCGESTALLYCRADSAKLCFGCDRHVHAGNALFSKHLRSHLCDVCESSPASTRCYGHDLFLCHNCDWDCHDGRGSPVARHDRRPLDGFSGCPSACEFASALGFEDKVLLEADEGGDAAAMVDGFLDAWVWETPTVVSLDDLIVPTANDSSHNFQALGVSPPTKHRNVASGKHKDEILHQLRDLFKTEANLNNNNGELEPVLGFQSVVSDQNIEFQNIVSKVDHDTVPISATGSKASRLHSQGKNGDKTIQVPSFGRLLESTIEETAKIEVPADIPSDGTKANDKNIEPDYQIIRGPTFHPKSMHELAAQERGSAISRYKEKKKTRRYDKHIRYESRKARADSRMRIKGRFAKVNPDQSINSSPRQF